MFRAPLWFVCIWKRAFPLIYWCMGLCNEYAKLWHTLRVIGYWWHHLQVRGVQFLLSGQDTRGLARRAAFTWHRYRSVSTDLLMTCHHATPKLFLPLLVVPPLPFPSLYHLISAGFRTKSHLGKATCKLRWAFTHKRQLLLNICLPGSKTSLFTPLYPTPPPTTSPPLPLLFLLPKLPIH